MFSKVILDDFSRPCIWIIGIGIVYPIDPNFYSKVLTEFHQNGRLDLFVELKNSPETMRTYMFDHDEAQVSSKLYTTSIASYSIAFVAADVNNEHYFHLSVINSGTETINLRLEVEVLFLRIWTMMSESIWSFPIQRRITLLFLCNRQTGVFWLKNLIWSMKNFDP